MHLDRNHRRRCGAPGIPLAIVTLAIVIGSPAVVPAAPLVPAVASSVAKAIVKYFGKEGAQQATEYLSKQGGEAIVQRVAAKAAAQGGDDAVQQVARLTGKHGPEAVAALDNAPDVMPALNALDEIPANQVDGALAKLAAGAPGRQLAEAVSKFGPLALRSELKHPGVGLVLVRSLGDEGGELAARLSPDQAITVARHADELAQLPASQRQGVLALLRQDTEAMVAFIGRFVAANPGKTLFTVATTTVILAEPERILGGDEVVFDADGNPIVVSKSGLLGRSVQSSGAVAEHISERYLRPLYLAALAFVGAFATLWAGLKLWHLHRRHKLTNTPSDP